MLDLDCVFFGFCSVGLQSFKDLGSQFFDQVYFGVGYQFVDVYQDQYVLFQGIQVDQVVGVEGGVYFWCWFDLFLGQGDDVGYVVDYYVYDVVVDVQDDDDGELVIGWFVQLEFDVYVYDGDDDVVQVYDVFDEVG